jgi:hypothetical protein
MKCYEKGVVVISSDVEGSDRLDTIRSRIGNQFFAHKLEDLRECLGGSRGRIRIARIDVRQCPVGTAMAEVLPNHKRIRSLLDQG